MRKSIILAAVAVAGLSGCLDGATTVDGVAHSGAKTVVNGIVASRFPGVDASVATDCIIDNASAAEILTIGQAAIVGTTAETTSLVLEIAQRQATVACIAQDTLGAGNIFSVLG